VPDSNSVMRLVVKVEGELYRFVIALAIDMIFYSPNTSTYKYARALTVLAKIREGDLLRLACVVHTSLATC